MYEPTDQQLVLQTIRDVAGEAGLRAVRKARGGTEVWIPLDPAPDHWMSAALGHEAAQEVCRRLTVIDADGRRTCNMRCYIGMGQSRIQEFKAQIAGEICEALLSGLSVRETAFQVRVSEKDVQRHRSCLVAEGRLSPLPLRQGSSALHQIVNATARPDEEKALRALKIQTVDEGVLRGQSNRKVSMAAQVSTTFVRNRRRILLTTGQLKPGRLFVVPTP